MRITSLFLFNLSAFLKSQMFLLPVLYLFYLSNGLTQADYFLFQGLIVLMNVFLQIPAGYIGDKVSRRTIIIFSYIFFLGRIFLWYFFKGYWIVLFGELFYAVSKALFDAVESPYIYDVLLRHKKTHKMVRAYSKLNFALSAGTGIAALIGAWLYQTVGLQVLLITEFIFISAAILMAFKLPDIKTIRSRTISLKSSVLELGRTMLSVFQKNSYRFFILYSALLVACSHFFFWSFQPLMNAALVPVALFGVVMFVNNAMRSLCSLWTDKIL